MTWDDLYVTVTLLSVVVSIAALAGWSIDRWPEWRQNHKAFEHEAGRRWTAWTNWAFGTPGTVWNPADPSPSRRTRP